MINKLHTALRILLLASFVLAGCTSQTPTPAPVNTDTPPTPATNVEAPPATVSQESPDLAALVKAGQLPPLAQRLPEQPLMVKGTDGLGKYGGNWRLGVRGGTDDAGFTRVFAYDPLVRWNQTYTGLEPNVAEQYEVNADATEFTFHLRKGMKWSDGEPYTADDILFWYEDVVMNPDLGGGVGWMKSGGEMGKVTKVDDYTVKFTFAKPYGMFLSTLATPDGQASVNLPKHYAMQFHPKYTDQAKLDEAIKAAGLKTWKELFEAKVNNQAGGGPGRWANAERPGIEAWVIDQPYTGNATQVVFKRNPYYWKVDPAGNQYPYIDKLIYDVYADIPPLLLKATNGEIDYMARHFNTLDNKAILFDNQAKGDYHLFDMADDSSNKQVIMFNLTHKDPTKRQVFQNKDFRIGLSYALNRQEIIDTIYISQGEPWQAAPAKGTPFYNAQLAKQYTEYDVAKANASLDKVLPKKGADGMRLGPDGQPFSFIIEVSNANKDIVDASALIVKYWKAVGVNAEAKSEDRTLLYQNKDQNSLDAMIWKGEGGVNPIMDPRSYFPNSTEAAYAEAWQAWYNDPTNTIAEEPPVAVKQQMDLYNQLKATADAPKQIEIMNQILQISADEFYCLGISTPPSQYGIVKNYVKNLPKGDLLFAWSFPSQAPYNLFTLYFDK